MKKTLLIILLSLISCAGYCDTYYFAWDGVGFCPKYNYNLGQCWGSYQYKGVTNGLGTGIQEIFQQFNLYYDKERSSTVGSSLRINTLYRFYSPMVVFQLNKSGSSQCYITGGVGQLQSGLVTLKKWSRNSWSQAGETYDSTVDQTINVNAYVIRAGLGFTQFYRLGGNFHLFLNEDMGFLVSPILPTDNNTMALKGNTLQLLQPSYFSFRIGVAFITHSRDSDTPYRIYR